MIYRFNDFVLDTNTGELKRGDTLVPLEPQTYRVLRLLVENQGRLISKDEIIEHIWHGRPITDSVLATGIRQVRTAIGDSGIEQKYIKTYSKRGFRFVAPVDIQNSANAASPLEEGFKFQAKGRPTIAILPFRSLGNADNNQGALLGNALAHDLIAEVAKANWLFVIARDSTFQFSGQPVDFSAIHRTLDAEYCMTGEVTTFDKEFRIFVELVHTQSNGVVWANVYEAKLDDVHEVRAEIAAHIHSWLERRVLALESERARLKQPENLDAWSLYHVGLNHLYRFTESEAVIAQKLFAEAVEREPMFARAHAGLSSAYSLCAQLDREGANSENARLAKAAAERAVEADPLDPFANFSLCAPAHMAGEFEEAANWAERAIAISPNYSHAISALGWLGVVCGHGEKEQELADLAMKLSPLDPLYYGMQVTRVMSHIVRGQYEDAATWVEKALITRSKPSPFLDMIAIASHELDGNRQEAHRRTELFKKSNPGVDQTVFFQAFPFKSKKHQTLLSKALSAHGL
jgi:TolB-like protein/Tfp pilus assembly protein PilF